VINIGSQWLIESEKNKNMINYSRFYDWKTQKKKNFYHSLLTCQKSK
jgi:hypothetical protein